MSRSTTRPLTARHALVRRVASNLTERCGVRAGDRLLLGVSGGADSMALLALVTAAMTRLQVGIEVAHFDHGLRRESADDAEFVRDQVESLGLPFSRARWQKPLPGEAAARSARLEFLEQTAQRRGCAAIVLAHHLEDQIETVLLQLGRGAGLRGWLGMSWRRDGVVPILRPLLDVRRPELREALAECGWVWREDATNRSRRMARNRLRLDALPALDAALPEGWMERVAASLDDLRQVWEPVREAAATYLSRSRGRENGDTLRIAALSDAPEIVQRQALEMWLGPELGGELSRAHVNAALRMIQNDRKGQRLILPNGWELIREGDQLTRRSAGTDPRARPSGELRVAMLDPKAAQAAVDQRRIGLRAERGRGSKLAPATTSEPGLLDAAKATGALELRAIRPGDRVQLLGAPGSRSLKQILQDRKIPANLRPGWPVVTDEKGIVWVPGIGIADRVRLTSRTRRAMQLRFTQKTSRNGVAGSHPRA